MWKMRRRKEKKEQERTSWGCTWKRNGRCRIRYRGEIRRVGGCDWGNEMGWIGEKSGRNGGRGGKKSGKGRQEIQKSSKAELRVKR